MESTISTTCKRERGHVRVQCQASKQGPHFLSSGGGRQCILRRGCFLTRHGGHTNTHHAHIATCAGGIARQDTPHSPGKLARTSTCPCVPRGDDVARLLLLLFDNLSSLLLWDFPGNAGVSVSSPSCKNNICLFVCSANFAPWQFRILDFEVRILDSLLPNFVP